MRALVLALLLLGGPAAMAQPPSPNTDEAAIRALVANWYEELAKKREGRPRSLTAPGFITSTPYSRHVDTGAASLGPRVYTSLAARALKFSYEIEAMRIDATFAKVDVWERGYFYAFAAQQTYESAADTAFILERQEKDGRWLILAHRSGTQGIPPNKITRPMPDLRDLFYATEGKLRDAEADAQKAGKF